MATTPQERRRILARVDPERPLCMCTAKALDTSPGHDFPRHPRPPGEMHDVKVPADLISRVTDAAAALDAFTAALQQRCPAIVRLWRAQLGRVHPVPGLPARGPQCDLHDEPVSR
jgi:hypothetical protein